MSVQSITAGPSPVEPGPQRKGRRRALQVLALAAGLLLIRVAMPVVVGLLLGVLVAFVMQPFYDRLLRWRLRPSTAASLCAASSVVFIGAAILCVCTILVVRGIALVTALPEAVAPGGVFHPLARQAARLLGTLHIAPGDPLSRVREGIGSLAYHTTGLAQGVARAVAMLFLTMFFLGLAAYYALVYWPAIVKRAEKDLPFEPLHTRALFAEFRNVGRQTLFGTVSAGLMQGVLATLGFWLTGVPEAIFLGALTAAVSLLPGVGVTVVWLGAGLFLIFTGHPVAGFSEIAYGALFVSVAIDTVVRPRLVGRDHLPALFTFIGLLGGVAVFGLIGLIVGPVVVSLCIAVLKIYDEETGADASPPA